jgi:hypothetical protein
MSLRRFWRQFGIAILPIAVLLTHGQLSSSARGQLSVPREELLDHVDASPAEEDWDIPPLTFFDTNMHGDPIVDSYILAYLSDRIYAKQTGYDQIWVDEFVDELLQHGALNVEFTSHPQTGAEVAAVETFTSLIIVHRGSSSAGSKVFYRITDWYQDFDDDVVKRFIGKENVYVHEGFWRSSASVYNWILPIVEDAYQRGKNIWVTGHSLGGANAMLTAARLHYHSGIHVSGVETFGAPRVGGDEFAFLVNTPNGEDLDLATRTVRWVVDGDSAVSLFGGDFTTEWIDTRWGRMPKRVWIEYHHTGIANHIFRVEGPDGPEYTLMPDAPDFSNDFPFSFMSLNDEHLDYDRALDAILIQHLTDIGDLELLTKLLKL